MAQGSTPEDALSLLDWKRRVLELYEGIRADGDPERAWRRWRETRDELFRTHPQSPLPVADREGFEGLDYYDYDPAVRVLAEVKAAEPKRYEIGTSGDGAYAFTRFGEAAFELGGETLSLELYWLEGTAAASSCRSPTRPAGPIPTARNATCSTPSRAPTWEPKTGAWSWT